MFYCGYLIIKNYRASKQLLVNSLLVSITRPSNNTKIDRPGLKDHQEHLLLKRLGSQIARCGDTARAHTNASLNGRLAEGNLRLMCETTLN